jgi:hypothetical protein
MAKAPWRIAKRMTLRLHRAASGDDMSCRAYRTCYVVVAVRLDHGDKSADRVPASFRDLTLQIVGHIVVGSGGA